MRIRSQLTVLQVPGQTREGEASVRTEFAEEDAKAINKGKFKDLGADLTPSQFILQGVELEERKHLISLKALGPATKSVDRSRLIQAGNMIKRRFDSWETSQRAHMPGVFTYRQEGDGDVGTAPGAATQVQDIRLLLPSDIVNVEELSLSLKLARFEFRIRVAQAHSAIRELRGLLLWRSQRIISKKKYSSDQKYGSEISGHQTASGEAGEHPQGDCMVKGTTGAGGWHLRSLTTFDVGYGDGKRKLAWIWNVHSSGEKPSVAVLNTMRIEFSRARARAHRWQEECILLREEMRRVAQFWAHGAKTWTERAELYEKLVEQRLPPSAAVAAFPQLVDDEHNLRVGSFYGKIAYARRQAALRERLRENSVKAHAHLVEPLLHMDKGDGKVLDGTVMVECKGRPPLKKREKGGKKKRMFLILRRRTVARDLTKEGNAGTSILIAGISTAKKGSAFRWVWDTALMQKGQSDLNGNPRLMQKRWRDLTQHYAAKLCHLVLKQQIRADEDEPHPLELLLQELGDRDHTLGHSGNHLNLAPREQVDGRPVWQYTDHFG
ncbi:hypothetical protein NMY22_g9219 [Coprinellus aureogranulatus]|nr:hypothetical protein NMY22_g9219 [Coprinellus aureogranulatus]